MLAFHMRSPIDKHIAAHTLTLGILLDLLKNLTNAPSRVPNAYVLGGHGVYGCPFLYLVTPNSGHF